MQIFKLKIKHNLQKNKKSENKDKKNLHKRRFYVLK